MFKSLLIALFLIAVVPVRILAHHHKHLIWRHYGNTEVNYYYVGDIVPEVEIDSKEWYDFATPLWEVDQHNDDDMYIYNTVQDYCEGVQSLEDSEDFFINIVNCL